MDKLVLYIYKKNTSTVVPVCSMAFFPSQILADLLAFFVSYIFFIL